MYFSFQTGFFYAPAIHWENIPSDAVEITDDEHAAFLAGLSAGKRMVANAKGHPVLTEPNPSNDELAIRIRAERDARLAACDWTQVTDAPVDQAAWRVYRQALRDITIQPGFPASVDWPVAPQ